MKMTPHFVIAMFALMSSCLATAGPEPSAQCELSPVNASHPVQALMESFTVLSGCASRGTTGLPQEVHVLNLRGPDPGPGQPQREEKWWWEEEGGEEEMQFLRSAADSSDSLAAIITHFIYASQRNQEKREFELLQKQQQENILVELLTMKTGSNKTIEAKEKHLKE